MKAITNRAGIQIYHSICQTVLVIQVGVVLNTLLTCAFNWLFFI